MSPRVALALDIVQEEALCEANGVSFLSFPIGDRDVPSSTRSKIQVAKRSSVNHWAYDVFLVHGS